MPRVFVCPTCKNPGHFSKSCPLDPARNLAGKRLGRWLVVGLGDPPRDKYSRWMWAVECSCENKTRKNVDDQTLRTGQSLSCGCVPREEATHRCGNCGQTGHYISTCPKPKIESDEKRICPKCELPKRLDEFSPQNRRCRTCKAEDATKLRAATPIEPRECATCGELKQLASGRKRCSDCNAKQQRLYFAKCKAEGRDFDWVHSLRTSYGVNPAWYQAQLTRYGHRCPACGTNRPSPEDDRFKHFAVHHNHTTGRALFTACLPCNRGAGAFKDDPTLLLLAADYLERKPPELRSFVPVGETWAGKHLSADDRAKLLDVQSGVCAICKKPGELHADHDHETGLFRGLIHNVENRGLGLFQEEPTIIRAFATLILDHTKKLEAGGKSYRAGL